jgi:hypothetical protein
MPLTHRAEEAQFNKGSSVVEFAKILAGRGSTDLHKHLGRRAWLCIWLQIMASWSGITVSPDLLHLLWTRRSETERFLRAGRHRLLARPPLASRLLVDHAARSCRRPEHHWYYRHHY